MKVGAAKSTSASKRTAPELSPIDPTPLFEPSLLKPLSRAFFDRDPRRVSRELLGKVLVREEQGLLIAGRIVELEAYMGMNDPAAHAAAGRAERGFVWAAWTRIRVFHLWQPLLPEYLLHARGQVRIRTVSGTGTIDRLRTDGKKSGIAASCQPKSQSQRPSPANQRARTNGRGACYNQTSRQW